MSSPDRPVRAEASGTITDRLLQLRAGDGEAEDETADVLGVTARTVRRDWVKAKG